MSENKREDQIVELVVTVLGSGIVGYFVGRAKYGEWENFIEMYNKRLGALAYFKVVIPVASLNLVNTWQVYREGINAYLFGLPNASIPTVFRCFEIGLRFKYGQITSKKGDLMGAYDLTEWAESYLGDKKEIAHGFRILRNILHKEKMMKEQDALECIRHLSEILNLLYPFSSVNFKGKCAFCGNPYAVKIMKANYYLGNIQSIRCNNCQQVNYVTIL